MPRYLFVRRDGWTRYADVPREDRTWVLAEQEPTSRLAVPPCAMHKDCLENAEMAYECSRSRLASPRSTMATRRMFERHEFQGVPWSDNRSRPTFIFLEEGMRPDDFVERWREFPT